MAEQRPSPPLDFHEDERRLASARKYREIRNELGRAFQITQAEAEASYRLWEEQLESENQEAYAMRWVSALWHPFLAGEPVAAADINPQEQVFYSDDGEIKVTCEWRAAYRDQPAIVRIAWQAQITLAGDFWVRFTQMDDPTAVLSEVRLGTALEGEAVFIADVLGFDPTSTPWALALLVKEPQG